jgi:FlaA1/EpsC-like NDP-sugar epimerase
VADTLMTRRIRSTLTLVTRAFDIAAGLFLLLLVFTFVNLGRIPAGSNDFLSARLTVRTVVLLAFFLVIWNASFAHAGLHEGPPHLDLWPQIRRIIRATSIGTLPLLLIHLISDSGAFSMLVVVTFWVVATLVEIAGRATISLVARTLTRSSVGSVRAIIIGSGPRARRLLRSIQEGGHTEYRLLGFMDDPGTHDIDEDIRARLLGTLDDLRLYLARNAVDQVLITLRSPPATARFRA